MPRPVETVTPAVIKKVKFPVPSQRLIDYLKTAPAPVQRDMANYMIEVQGLGELVGR